MPEYLVRADLDFSWSYHERNGRSTLMIPYKLPINIGPFKLDDSPNKGVFLAELGLVDWDQLTQHQPEREYPTSMLYLELKVRGSGSAEATAESDNKLELIECLFRLFRTGDVSVRRHGSVLRADRQRPSLEDLVASRPIKPRMEPLYARPPYPLSDDVLADFVQFFSRHWGALSHIKPYLKTAMTRFNSSYERRDLSDRLIDLVIALEALFGDRNPGSIGYKLAMRCACWLHPAGQDRVKLFSQIKKYYVWRSDAVHAGKPGAFSEADVTKLEDVVRNCLTKFLDYQIRDGCTPHDREIDDLVMLAKI